MNKCAKSVFVERYFDGDGSVPGDFSEHLVGCRECSDYLEELRVLRRGVVAVRAELAIEDGRFPAFMAGVESELARPSRGWGGFLAVASVVTAALIMAVSTVVIFSGEVERVEAKTEVEYVGTDLVGATTTVNYSEDGPATVWLNVPEDDMW